MHIRACETETHAQETAEASEACLTISFDDKETPRLSVLRSMTVFLSMTVLLCYREHAHGIKELEWLRPWATYHALWRGLAGLAFAIHHGRQLLSALA